MPNYYNPYLPSVGSGYYASYYPPQSQSVYNGYMSGAPAANYWISVDGEMAARAWQMPPNLAPNTIIPLWDLDGQHVYFKSTDAYGRVNPLRKGRVIFDEEPQNLPENQGVNGNSGMSAQNMDSRYVTKEDFEGLRHEIQDMLRNQQTPSPSNQNENNQQRWKNRGDSK